MASYIPSYTQWKIQLCAWTVMSGNTNVNRQPSTTLGILGFMGSWLWDTSICWGSLFSLCQHLSVCWAMGSQTTGVPSKKHENLESVEVLWMELESKVGVTFPQTAVKSAEPEGNCPYHGQCLKDAVKGASKQIAKVKWRARNTKYLALCICKSLSDWQFYYVFKLSHFSVLWVLHSHGKTCDMVLPEILHTLTTYVTGSEPGWTRWA